MKNKKIKILYLIGRLKVGGAEKLAVSVASGLDKDIFEIVFVTLYEANAYREELEKNGVKIIELKRKSWLDIKNFRKLLGIIKHQETDIIHTYLMPSDIWGGLAAKFTKTKAISGILNLGFSDGRKDRLRPLVSRLFVRLIAVGSVVKKRLVDFHKIKSSKIEVIHNGIDVESLKGSYREPDFSKPVVGMLARLEAVKGHIYLLKACHKLLQEGYKFKVVFIGSGPDERGLKEEAESLGLAGLIDFRGPRNNIIEELKNIDILAAPSLSEGFSLTLIEGMASGKAVISSRVGGAEEVISDKINGLLIEEENSDQLAEAIKYLIDNPEKAKELQSKAQERSQDFDINLMIKKYEILYENI